MEEWRDIKGYEGKYQISDLGRIKSLNYRGNTNQEHILKLKEARNGYNQVQLYKNGKGVFYLIHRLVAQAFIPNPDNLPIVNHKDENKENNNVDNLEWCTYEYNNNYGTINKRHSETMKGRKLSEEHKRKISNSIKGNKHPQAKKVKCITTGEIFDYIKEAGRKYNIGSSHISKCCKGKAKSAGKHPVTGEKLVWEYV